MTRKIMQRQCWWFWDFFIYIYKYYILRIQQYFLCIHENKATGWWPYIMWHLWKNRNRHFISNELTLTLSHQFKKLGGIQLSSYQLSLIHLIWWANQLWMSLAIEFHGKLLLRYGSSATKNSLGMLIGISMVLHGIWWSYHGKLRLLH